jgi:hypothetical protein
MVVPVLAGAGYIPRTEECKVPGENRNRRPPERQQQERRSQQQQQQQRPRRPKFFDVHFRMGIDDIWVRITPRDYQKLIDYWILGAEDVVLRSVSESKETDIVLRGSQGGFVTTQPASPERKVATYNFFRADDLRRQWLEQHGHPEVPDQGGEAG